MDKVTICNMALGVLGHEPITDFTDDSKAAQLCSAHYEPAVKATLEEAAWTFATTRGTTSISSASGDVDRPSRFQLPSTVLRVLSCGDAEDPDYPLDWRLEEGLGIICEEITTLAYKAIRFVDDPMVYTGNFVRALTYRLAADLSIALSSDKRAAETLEAKFLREVRKAAGLDGTQGRGDTMTFRSKLRR